MSKKKTLKSDLDTTLYDFIFYMHRCKVNNKRYVGATTQKSVLKRWKNGKGYSFNTELTFDIQTYGVDNFEHIELLRKTCTISEAKGIEETLISKYKPEYNQVVRGIKIISPNASKSMQEKMKSNPEWCKAKVKDCLIWQKEHPEESKRLKQQNATKATEQRKRKVICVETGIVYESASEAARQTNSLQAKITECCRGNRNKTNNLHWKYY